METLNDVDPRSSRRRRCLLTVLLVGVFTAIAWAPGVVPIGTASAAGTTCQSYTYCFQLRSAMNGKRALDASYAGPTQDQAVTLASPWDGFWGVSSESSADKAKGLFQLRLVGLQNWCLTEPTSGSQLDVVQCVNAPGTDADRRQNWTFFGPSSNSGQYSLRSAFDGKCVDVLNGTDSDLAQVGAWTCNSFYGSANQLWTVADYSGTTNAPGVTAASPSTNSTAVGQLARQYSSTVVARQAVQQNTPGSISFCNWGGYVAWATVNYARITPSNAFLSGRSTPDLLITQCSSIPVPAGQGVAAEITLHVHFGTNDVTAATYFLTAAYTKTTFNFYGTVCGPSIGVDANDSLSGLLTTTVNAGISNSCEYTDFATAAKNVLAARGTVDSNLAVLNTQLGYSN
jgi:hypothetical protein